MSVTLSVVIGIMRNEKEANLSKFLMREIYESQREMIMKLTREEMKVKKSKYK